ncbi:MAG: DUF4863 family protein [Burkholderiales bacterium]|jgi:hypothetical protein|nr:DUF4863 family protein [Burkholderiales bacterium]
MTTDEFRALVEPVTRFIAGRELDSALEADLNGAFPGECAAFRAIESACHAGIAAGWMCAQGAGKRKFGRIFEPADDLARFSVDVVDITDLVGNHHRHPTGEIDMIMPVGAAAKFDGRGRGWLVYPPDSGHRPTVTGGRALVLYLLPEGQIEWSSS